MDKLFQEVEQIDQKIKEAVEAREKQLLTDIPEEFKTVIANIEAFYGGLIDDLGDTRSVVESQIKSQTLVNKQTFKAGNGYQAIYAKGRTTWDSKALTGYAAAHPEIEQFKKVGEPSVRIKR